MRRLYIDFDGVVMDTIPLLYNELEKNGYQGIVIIRNKR